MSNPRAKAATLVRKPKNDAIGPGNLVNIAKKAKTAGIPIFSVKNASDNAETGNSEPTKNFLGAVRKYHRREQKARSERSDRPRRLKQTKRALFHKAFEQCEMIPKAKLKENPTLPDNRY